MDQSALSMTPIVISMVVGLIGVIGAFAALRAAYELRKERGALRRGRALLRDLPIVREASFDYRVWIKEQDARLSDSHFGDHLLAASDAAKSGRAVTLQELHEISGRREARRYWARLSGGITALLLICGIAGTLWAIKPLLGDFALDVDLKGVSAAGNVEQAIHLIRSLGTAFLPSLVALVLTLVVASARGLYSHRRGLLAGDLDRLDLEDLFPRFPPPSLSRELDEIRAQLGDLTAQMLASQRNLDGFVERLADAAKGFHEDAPSLHAASRRFFDGVHALSPRLDDLNTAIGAHLGADSPLVRRFDGLLRVSTEVSNVAAQMQTAGVLLTKQLSESHRLLKDTAGALSGQIREACQAGSKTIANAMATALESASTTAVRHLDEAAAPLRDAARSMASANQALKDEASQALQATTAHVQNLCDMTSKSAEKDIGIARDEVRSSANTLQMAARKLADATQTIATIQPRNQVDQSEEQRRLLQDLNALTSALTRLETNRMTGIGRVYGTARKA